MRKRMSYIELYAQQFKWTARYAGEDNVLQANVRYIEGINVVGADLSDSYGEDDIVVLSYTPKRKEDTF
jgi:cytochrome c oxidase subunit 2